MSACMKNERGDSLYVLCKFSTLGSVKAVNEVSSCSPTWVSELEVDNHDLLLKPIIKYIYVIKPRFDQFTRAKYNIWIYFATFRRGTTEQRPMKLTMKRKPIIQLKLGFLMFISRVGEFASDDCAAIVSLIPNR